MTGSVNPQSTLKARGIVPHFKSQRYGKIAQLSVRAGFNHRHHPALAMAHAALAADEQICRLSEQPS